MNEYVHLNGQDFASRPSVENRPVGRAERHSSSFANISTPERHAAGGPPVSLGQLRTLQMRKQLKCLAGGGGGHGIL
jgi:hypothetical protein